MRFGIRTQAAFLTLVPALGLLTTVLLSALAVERTEQQSQATQRLTAIVQLTDTIAQELSIATRGAALYVLGRRAGELAAYRSARSAYAGDERRFRALVATFPSLRSAGAAYAAKMDAGMALIATYLAVYRAEGGAAAARFARAPAAREFGSQLQQVEIRFDEALQSRALTQAAVSRSSLRDVEERLGLCAILGLALSFATSLLYGIRTARRLDRLGANARRLASGEPTLPVAGNDEIAALDALYRKMAATIQASSRAHEAALLQLDEERDNVALLQRSLLPELPQIAGLDISSAYATPAGSAKIGGDWFDVFELPDGRVGVSIGDVTGHGLKAATVMGFVRQAIRVVAWRQPDPAAALRYVNDLLWHDGQDLIVSAFFGILDPASQRLSYATAGHPPPIVASTDGSLTLLSADGLLLGVDQHAGVESREHQLRGGDTLVLYTDGLVELERDYFKGMSDLAEAVRSEIVAGTSDPAEAIQRRIFANTAPRDDAAVLVVTVPGDRAPRTNPSHRDWEFGVRSPLAGRKARYELLQALSSVGPPGVPDRVAAELGVGEVLSDLLRSARALSLRSAAGETLERAPGGSGNGYREQPFPVDESGGWRTDLVRHRN